ncbi:hypothetical protein ACQP2F_26315 [Actinoplanes sp. CA-030573]|uniref:hypothetical protein n=1 Tax=Actinoplanes sp. CA-030573 TaxID=3239898 RepID=UPI003D94EB28
MEDRSGRTPTLDRVGALRADATRARDRAHQRAATAQQWSERAGKARRDAQFAHDRAAQLRADQLSRRAITDLA